MGFLNNDNYGKHLSRLLEPALGWVDLPGIYKVSGLYTGNIANNGSANVEFEIPLGSDLDFRFIGLSVLIRSVSSNNVSFFRIDLIHKVVGESVSLMVGESYSLIGINSSQVVISNNGSNKEYVKLSVLNSASGDVQVQITPEFSSRLSELN